MARDGKKIIKKIFSILGWIIFLIPILFFILCKSLLEGFGYKK